jgi:hypothetical protein
MGKPKYARVNKTALEAAMNGFIYGLECNKSMSNDTIEIVRIFQDMVIQYLEEESKDVEKEEEQKET